MSKKYTPRAGKARGRSGRSGANPLIWVGGILGILVLLVSVNVLQ